MKKHYCPCGQETDLVMGDFLRLCKNKTYPHLWYGDEGISRPLSVKMAQEIIRLRSLVKELERVQTTPA